MTIPYSSFLSVRGSYLGPIISSGCVRQLYQTTVLGGCVERLCQAFVSDGGVSNGCIRRLRQPIVKL